MSLLERIKEEERKIHEELVELSQAIYEHPNWDTRSLKLAAYIRSF